jgi:pimeloyl-ACP methyl ester carboxylesterase
MGTELQGQDQFITLNGLRVHYLDWGAAAAPPLVLLHGLGTEAHMWDTVARALVLQDHCRVLVPDLRGHGQTDWAEDYAVERWVEDLHAFVRALALPPLTLVGISMGGGHAWRYAAAHPERVARLVLVDIAPEQERAGMLRIGAAFCDTPDVFDDLAEAIPVLRAIYPTAPDAALWPRLLDNVIRQPDGRWTWRYDPAFRVRTGLSFTVPSRTAQWALLPTIACPTLVVRAAGSDVVSRTSAERMVRELPQGRWVEVPDSGHGIHLDNATALIAAIRAFLREA